MKENNPPKQFGLDLKDRKILYELDKDCRQSCPKIAKKVGLSSEVVNYRINRLEKEKIITQYQVCLNLSKLGLTQFKILLSFQHLKSEEINKIIDEMKKDKKVLWIVSCKGDWDLSVAGEVESLSEIDVFKNKILSLFEGHVEKKGISICTEADVFNRDYLISQKAYPERTKKLVDSQKREEIDALDLKIIKELAENARKSIVDLAEKFNSTPRVIDYRIKQLIKLKIITGFRIAIDYEKLNIKFYKTFFYLDAPKENRLNELMNFLKYNKNVIHNLRVLGNWDLEPEFEVSSEEEFDKLLTEIKDKFSDIIKNIEVITISKEHKFVYL
ncbi:MAG: winged helix-turn-helix transcriptional regulator [Nanoarchaeota archaeon]